MAEFGIDSLKANLSNPQRPYIFDVLIPVPLGGGASETYQFRVRSSEIPKRGNKVINIPFKQTAGVAVAGALEYDHTWACSFMEGEDRKVFDAIYGWQQLVVNDVAGVGVGDPLYKTDAYLVLLGTDGSTTNKIKMKGIWPSSVDKVALKQGDGDPVEFNVTFTFDSWESAN
jgi:hypothetical protein